MYIAYGFTENAQQKYISVTLSNYDNFHQAFSENIPSKKCPKMPRNILLSSCLTKHVLTTRFHRNYTWILSLQFLSNLEVCIHLVLWTHQTWYETHWNEFQGNQTREKLIWSRFLFGLKLMWKMLGLLFSYLCKKFKGFGTKKSRKYVNYYEGWAASMCILSTSLFLLYIHFICKVSSATQDNDFRINSWNDFELWQFKKNWKSGTGKSIIRSVLKLIIFMNKKSQKNI